MPTQKGVLGLSDTPNKTGQREPNMLSTQPSGDVSQPHEAAPQPGWAVSQPDKVASQPGEASPQPGGAASQPGEELRCVLGILAAPARCSDPGHSVLATMS